MPTVATYTDFRQNLSRYMDIATNDSEEILITRRRGSSVVMMSKAEYDAMQETMFFTGDGNRMERLKQSEQDFAEGRTTRYSSTAELRKRAMEHAGL